MIPGRELKRNQAFLTGAGWMRRWKKPSRTRCIFILQWPLVPHRRTGSMSKAFPRCLPTTQNTKINGNITPTTSRPPTKPITSGSLRNSASTSAAILRKNRSASHSSKLNLDVQAMKSATRENPMKANTHWTNHLPSGWLFVSGTLICM